MRPSTVDRSSPQAPARLPTSGQEGGREGRTANRRTFHGRILFWEGEFCALRATVLQKNSEGGPLGLWTLGVRVGPEQLRRKARGQWHAAAFSRGAQSARERAAFWEVWFLWGNARGTGNLLLTRRKLGNAVPVWAVGSVLLPPRGNLREAAGSSPGGAVLSTAAAVVRSPHRVQGGAASGSPGPAFGAREGPQGLRQVWVLTVRPGVGHGRHNLLLLILHCGVSPGRALAFWACQLCTRGVVYLRVAARRKRASDCASYALRENALGNGFGQSSGQVTLPTYAAFNALVQHRWVYFLIV